jgi:hypothetical protein
MERRRRLHRASNIPALRKAGNAVIAAHPQQPPGPLCNGQQGEARGTARAPVLIHVSNRSRTAGARWSEDGM